MLFVELICQGLAYNGEVSFIMHTELNVCLL